MPTGLERVWNGNGWPLEVTCVWHDNTSSCVISILSHVKCPQVWPVWVWDPFQLNEV